MAKMEGNLSSGGGENGDHERQPLQKLKNWFSQGLYISEDNKCNVQIDLETSARPDAGFLILALLSCAIATFGLINDSPAVIIGAMLVGPLMTPILSAAMAYCTGRYKIILQSLITIGIGIGVVLAFSAILSLLLYRLPHGADIKYSGEVMAHMSPSLIDLLIALAAGSAAAFAMAHTRFSAALPGAAIAITLVPAICTAGIGISFLNPAIILGAGLLFVVNLAGIFFAAVLPFTILGFRPDQAE